MTEYKLMYFNGKGFAEVARYIFAYNDQKYEDIRWEFKDFPEWKPKLPLGQGPCLEVKEGGKTHMISQSNAINRYFEFHKKNILFLSISLLNELFC